jgi:hypothetical protein
VAATEAGWRRPPLSETRRYAAFLGATTEFSKMEYIAFNGHDRRKFYVVISRVEKGMTDGAGRSPGDPQRRRHDSEMSAARGRRDTDGNPINSHFVGTTLRLSPS